MKTPTEQPRAKRGGHHYDASTWITMAFAIILVVKLVHLMINRFA